MSRASATVFVVLLGVLVVGGFIAVGTAADTPDNTAPPVGAVEATVSVPGSRVQEELDAGAADESYAGTPQGLALLNELTSPKLPDDPSRQPLELTPVNIRLLAKAGMGEFLLDVIGKPGTQSRRGGPTVTVELPLADTILNAEVATAVEWDVDDPDGILFIDVFASYDNGATYSPIALALPGDETMMTWFPSLRPTPNAKIKVEATDTLMNLGSGETDGSFAVVSIANGLVATTLRDFDEPGTQPFEHGLDIRHLGDAPDDCTTCHGTSFMIESEAEPYFFWRGSMMANASRDPLFEACMVVAQQDAPGSGDLCLRCHIPKAWLNGRSTPTSGSQVLESDRIGVSCDVCHRMVDPIFDVDENPAEDEDILLGLLDAPTVFGTGMFVLDPEGDRRGPTPQGDTNSPHDVLTSPFHRDGAFCGTCHNVSNPVFHNDGSGNYIIDEDLDAPADDFSAGHLFPIERTYSEWLHSDYNTEEGVFNPDLGGNKDFVSTCQDCHMRDVGGQSCFFGVDDRPDMPQHDLTGGSTWMMGLLADLFPDDIDADAQANAVERGRFLLQHSADLEAAVDGDQLTVTVTNNTGHKLPTGYPDGRRMWINVQFYDDGDVLIGESAAYDGDTGELSHDAEAKIYEAELGLDEALADLIPELSAGISFHFVLNNKIFKDNRIPPRGFTNENFASFGGAPVDYSYPDFQYWDDTTYTIPADTSRIEIALYYQSTSKEYIEFLRDENTTNSKGQEMYDLWNDNDKSPPELMESVTVCSFDGQPNPIQNVTQGTSYCSIQKAIDEADSGFESGDEIVVEEGSYFENINFNGKAITLRSSDPTDPAVVANTIIDGGGNGTVVTCDSGEGPGTVLSGFTITGGSFGGMHNVGSSPTVTYCTFVENAAGGAGGGMANEPNSSPTVVNCMFIGNTAIGSSGGGMFNNTNSSPTLTNCAFIGNTTSFVGGGMFNANESNPTLINCTFSLNTVLEGDGTIFGGGAIGNGLSSPTLINCVLWGNTPDEIFNQDDGGSNPTVSFCDVQGGLSDGTIDGGGNIDADPMFVDAAGDDLRLLDGSPCVNTGDTSAIPADTADLDGDGDTNEPTPFDLDSLTRAVCDVDMGAYELQGGSKTVNNVTQGTVHCSIQDAIDAAVNSDELIVQPGTYFENINFNGKAITLRSSDPTDPAVIAATIIDGGGVGTTVTCASAEGPDTILVGFTITGGSANNGAGMLNDGSSPTVANCIFTGNDAVSLGGGMGNGSSGSPTVINCLFTGNTSFTGGGMANFSSSTPSIINCTFSGNEAAGGGGGMSNNTSASATVTNCIFWGDTAASEISTSGSTPTVTFCDVQGGFTGEGNINTDPLFADAGSGDYRLLAGSPCINTANFDALPPDLPDLDDDDDTDEPIPLDLDGLPRAVCAGALDMGAYEYQVAQSGPVQNITQGTFHCAIQDAIDAATNGDEVVVDQGTYFENINFNGKAITLRSTDPLDPVVVAATIIDANGDGSVVTCDNSEGPDTVLSGFTITGGNPAGDGGGMRNSGSSPTVTHCTFTGNTGSFGGGMANAGSSPTVTNCTFDGNTAITGGGGMDNFGGSNPTITNCLFISNAGASRGGGMHNENNSHPTVTNCTFSGNFAEAGGGMRNRAGCNPSVTNCTFSGNPAGSAMSNDAGTSPTVTSCIFWGNTDGEISGAGTPTVTFCDVQGGFVGEGNIDADPLFVDADGDDDTPGTEDDDLRLLACSPCINTGDTSAIPADTADLDDDGDTDEPTPFDLDGLTRAVCDVDMGAYEFQSPPPCTAPEACCLPDGTCLLVDPLCCDEQGGFQQGPDTVCDQDSCPLQFLLDQTEFEQSNADAGNLQKGVEDFEESTLPPNEFGFVDDPLEPGVPNDPFPNGLEGLDSLLVQSNTLGGAPDVPSPHGVEGLAALSAPQAGVSSDVVANSFSEHSFDIILIDPNTVSVGLNPLSFFGANAVEIRVYDTANNLLGMVTVPADPAGSTFAGVVSQIPIGRINFYTPGFNAGADNIQTWVPAPPEACCLPNSGCEDLTPTECADAGGQPQGPGSMCTGLPIQNVTQGTFHCSIQDAIDASTDGDEVVVDQGTYFENINFNGKAITLRSTDPLDPAVVAATIINADGEGTVVTCDSGEGSDTVLNGLTIANGSAPSGGGAGMLNIGSSPTVSNCTFTNNQADNLGGGMYNTEVSAPTVINCTFSGNTANLGGGMANTSSSSPTVTHCTFSGNTADNEGGGMSNTGSSPIVTNCTFSGNSSTGDGGGINNFSFSSPTLTNCTFSGNSASFGGGGLYNANSSNPTVTNCTFSGNTAATGGAIHNEDNSNSTVTNCVLWGDSPDEIFDDASTPTVTYSNVQGGYTGAGNIDADPLFVDADGDDDTPGTEDDDLRFLPGSPCIDGASNDGVPADAADLDDDGDTDEPTPLDLDGNPRFHDDPAAPDCPQDPGTCGTAPIVDMGAYESQATKVPCEGDANGDGTVDPLDSGFVLARFGCPVGTGDPSCDAADQNGDGAVDPLDSGFVLARFGPCP